jgi:hypothetical protein
MSRITTLLIGACAAILFYVSGCSGGGDEPVTGTSTTSSPADAFAGSWTFDSGAINLNCSIGASSQINLTGTMTVTKVDDTDVSATFAVPSATCNIGFSVTGATAAISANQTCTVFNGGTPEIFTITTGTLFFNSHHLVLQLAGGVPGCATDANGTFPQP